MTLGVFLSILSYRFQVLEAPIHEELRDGLLSILSYRFLLTILNHAVMEGDDLSILSYRFHRLDYYTTPEPEHTFNSILQIR